MREIKSTTDNGVRQDIAIRPDRNFKRIRYKPVKLLSLGKIYSDHTPYWENNNWFIALGINKLFYSTKSKKIPRYRIALIQKN